VVAEITLGGEVSVVAGSLNSTLVAEATSTAFGRTSGNGSVLYVQYSPIVSSLLRGLGLIQLLGLTHSNSRGVQSYPQSRI
jgi:hypothetical protein